MAHAQAQAQAEVQQQCTRTHSLQTVMGLVRTSISHVCWLRGLFPEDYFTEQKLQHLELSLQQLRADHDDTRRLQAWINTDVQMALEHGYLARLHLCICEDMQGTSVIEQYSYAFTYGTDADGNRTTGLDLHHSGSGAQPSSENMSPSTDFTKRQVVKMLRMLITINTTLLPLPEERCVLMKVEYTPDAPRTFATPNFRDATPAEATAAFATTPFTTQAGRLDMGHINMQLHVRSLCDSLAPTDNPPAPPPATDAAAANPPQPDALEQTQDSRHDALDLGGLALAPQAATPSMIGVGARTHAEPSPVLSLARDSAAAARRGGAAAGGQDSQPAKHQGGGGGGENSGGAANVRPPVLPDAGARPTPALRKRGRHTTPREPIGPCTRRKTGRMGAMQGS